MITRDDDLNDDISDLIGIGKRTATAPVAPPETYKPRDFTEPCPKCRGTGQFTGWSGRVFGPCFACKGAGKKVFKSSASDRAQSRAKATARRETKAAERREETAQSAIAWAEEFKAEYEWLKAASRRNTEGLGNFTFPQEMLNGLNEWGRLTDNQLAAVRKLMLRDAERAEARKQREANAAPVDISKIEQSFAHATAAAAKVGEGVKWLRVRLGDPALTFSPAGAASKNAGAIYVKAEDSYLGKIQGGKFFRSRECTDAHEAQIIAVAADPAAAAKAYGLRTKSCSCCGLELTNRVSLDRGIGPICAAKYGW